jgi:uncharacterized protein GlcG (DUF336 family)
MGRRTFAASAAIIAAVFTGPTEAAAPAQAPLPPGVPQNMPYFIPYGGPISLELAKKAVDAAHAEAVRRGWKMAIAVTNQGGDLVYFVMMDDTQLVSAEIAPRKARTAVRFRRPTKIFFDQMETGHPYVTSLDPDIVTAPGGIPIVIDGKLVGGIGCSGGAGVQDDVVCEAGLAALR